MKKSAEKRILKTSITVDRQLWRRFGAQLKLEGNDYSRVLPRLIERFLTETQTGTETGTVTAAETTIHPEHQRWHELLDRILLNAEDDDRLAITNMLEVFARFINKDGDDAPKR